MLNNIVILVFFCVVMPFAVAGAVALGKWLFKKIDEGE